jgi:hypothetical protein
MISLAVKVAAALAGLLIVVGDASWVAGWAPFQSPCAEVRATTEAAVSRIGAAEATALGKAEATTRAANTSTRKRIEARVASIRASTRNAPADDVPDGEFFRGVCASKLYAGSPDCVGYGGESEDPGAAAGARAVRRR